MGHVISYEYLWKSGAGETKDGRAAYPAAVILARDDLGPSPVAYVLGISHSPPRQDDRAMPVPPKLKRYLGLDDAPSWIYTDQLNVFVWPGPDLRPGEWLRTAPLRRVHVSYLPFPQTGLPKSETISKRAIG